MFRKKLLPIFHCKLLVKYLFIIKVVSHFIISRINRILNIKFQNKMLFSNIYFKLIVNILILLLMHISVS